MKRLTKAIMWIGVTNFFAAIWTMPEAPISLRLYLTGMLCLVIAFIQWVSEERDNP